MDLFNLADSEGNLTADSVADTLAKRVITCSGGLYDSLTLARTGVGKLTISAQREGNDVIILKAVITDAIYDKGTVKSFCTRTEKTDSDFILPGESTIIANALFNGLTGTIARGLIDV